MFKETPDTDIRIQDNWITPLKDPWLWGTPFAISLFLIIVAQYSFLGFHTLAELFAVGISFIMFALAWTTRRFSPNAFLLFLACGYLWIGMLDLSHALVYKGMDIFTEDAGTLSIQFWIIARFSEAVLLLIAPFATWKTRNNFLILLTMGIIPIGLIALAFAGSFPVLFEEGKGLTDFKVYCEYLIIFILMMTLIALHRCRGRISQTERVFITISIVLTMCAELAFTFYISLYGLSNLIGHILKVFSFWFIFQAIILSNIRKPYVTMAESEHRYRQMFDDNIAIFLIVNPANGRVVNASAGACCYYGYSLADLIAMRVSDINTMSEKAIINEMKLAAMESRNVFYFQHVLSSGEIRDVEIYSNPITIDGQHLLFSIINDVHDKKLVENELSKRTHDLSKRVKEQACLYIISEIFNRPDITIEDAIEMVVEAVPAGWQFPEITCARITINGRSYPTTGFKETEWNQSADIIHDEEVIGSIEIYYLVEKPMFDEGPFSHEERYLLDSIGTNIEVFLAKKKAEDQRIHAMLALGQASLGAVSAVAATIEKRDPYTSGHQKKVALLAVEIAKDLGWSEFKIKGLMLGASIHDIGKIYIPAEILNRPGKLSTPEFEMIKSHPQVGDDILKDTEFPWPIHDMIIQHHERIDGTGYPNGLTGDQIIEEAKVIAVADVVEAISSHRPYRAALGIEQGLEEIERGKGTAYDPAIVDSCIRVVKEQNFEW